MRPSIITLNLLSTSAMAMQAFTNADTFAAMLKRGDVIAKRQGYYPDTSNCGVGDTCEEACGPNQVECPSSSLTTLYCHSSVDGSHCCTDGSGSTLIMFPFPPLSSIAIIVYDPRKNILLTTIPRLLPCRVLLHIRRRRSYVLLPRRH